ncbi:GNAT family N-acetyltransferase [Paenibacillus sp. CC-CFT747]|nr:GNAT family N-acetyltransferase [Paenibacillus sp. CC-CFT747]
MIRKAELADLDFMVRIDLEDEGITPTSDFYKAKADLSQHREKIRKFVAEVERGALIYEEENRPRMGLLMYSVANRDADYPWKTIYPELDRGLFQKDGRFIEIFQLWVDPGCRRLGIATKLKAELEELAKDFGVDLIYTHTEEGNLHVLELNEKLGYQVVRRGPIWDEIVRVSLIKKVI